MSEQIKAEPASQTPSQPGVASTDLGPAMPEPTKTNTKLLIGLIGGSLVFLAILIGIIALLYTHPGPTAVIRDIFIIALAFTSLIIGLLLLVLVFQLQSLIALLRNEIKPMLTNANQTVNTVRGTAVFVSDNLVKPTINVASFVAGVKGVQQAIFGKVSSAGGRTAGTKKASGSSAK
jgi:NADH:ubiquinone oxidoreductase subunit K